MAALSSQRRTYMCGCCDKRSGVSTIGEMLEKEKQPDSMWLTIQRRRGGWPSGKEGFSGS